MMIDIELTEEEMENLSNGGFMTLVLTEGVRVTVTKDTDYNYDEDEC